MLKKMLATVLMAWLVTTIAYADDATPIKIGAIYNLDALPGAVEQQGARGAQLAIEEINAEGGVLGHPLELVIKDAKHDSKTTQQVAKELAEDPSIPVVIGLNNTTMLLDAVPPIITANKLVISSGATAPLIPQQVPGQRLFYIGFGDNTQAAAAAEFAYSQLHAATAVIVNNSDLAYTQGLARYFNERYSQLGGKVLLQASFTSNTSDFNQIISQIKTLPQPPQIIYVASPIRQAPAVIMALRQAGLKQAIIGGDSFDSPDIIHLAGVNANDIYFTTHAQLNLNSSDVLIRRFVTNYEAQYHSMPNIFTALDYDSVKVLARAIEMAKSTDPSAIQRALLRLRYYQIVTGELSYFPGSTIPVKMITIMVIKDQKPELAAMWTPQSVPKP